MTIAGEPKTKRSLRLLGLGAITAALAVVAGVVANIATVWMPLASVSAFVAEHGAAALLSSTTFRAHLRNRLIADRDQQNLACLDSVHAIDLDGNGVKSDVAVLFNRTESPSDCRPQNVGPLNAAFFRWSWGGFFFVGDPPLPNGLTAWSFAGPAAFREASDSSYPTIHVFMLQDGKIVDAGQIDTATSIEYEETRFVETEDRKSAWVLTAASISKVTFGPDGKPSIQQLSGKALAAENQGLHLLSFNAEGQLAYDGEPLSTFEPATGDSFNIWLSPGYRLYLVGCKPVGGLNPISDVPGAYAVDFSKAPSAYGALGGG